MNKVWRGADDRQLRTMLRASGWAALLTLSLCACEKIELPNEEEGDTEPKTEVSGGRRDNGLLRTGEGTKEAPCTVTQLLKGDWVSSHAGQDIYVVGYVVGEAYRTMSNACFSTPFAHDSNILLAADSMCCDTKGCIPVELSTAAMKRQASLLAHPEYHRQCIMVRGTLNTYLGSTGLRNATESYLLGRIDIPETMATDWEENTEAYQ